MKFKSVVYEKLLTGRVSIWASIGLLIIAIALRSPLTENPAMAQSAGISGFSSTTLATNFQFSFGVAIAPDLAPATAVDGVASIFQPGDIAVAMLNGENGSGGGIRVFSAGGAPKSIIRGQSTTTPGAGAIVPMGGTVARREVLGLVNPMRLDFVPSEVSANSAKYIGMLWVANFGGGDGLGGNVQVFTQSGNLFATIRHPNFQGAAGIDVVATGVDTPMRAAIQARTGLDAEFVVFVASNILGSVSMIVPNMDSPQESRVITLIEGLSASATLPLAGGNISLPFYTGSAGPHGILFSNKQSGTLFIVNTGNLPAGDATINSRRESIGLLPLPQRSQGIGTNIVALSLMKLFETETIKRVGDEGAKIITLGGVDSTPGDATNLPSGLATPIGLAFGPNDNIIVTNRGTGGAANPTGLNGTIQELKQTRKKGQALLLDTLHTNFTDADTGLGDIYSITSQATAGKLLVVVVATGPSSSAQASALRLQSR